ncbi:MAG TPA: GTP cyclohydrolase II [Actinomycetales bacterium]|nr:GTP cyclohydrolase II [Actinomycetales bacterium]
MTGSTLVLGTVADALDELRRGRPVLVVDDADRENEGDVVLPAQLATDSWVGWTVRHTSGVLCAPMPAEWADRLELPPMVADNQDPRRTAYTVSVDARHGISTGISAADRARTLTLLADARTSPTDLVRPGHVFPLRARPGGVLERAGHTEAAVDLCRLAGLAPVGLIAEVVHDDGSMMRLPELLALGAEHGLLTLSIADLRAWRTQHDRRGDVADGQQPVVGAARVVRTATTTLPTRHGRFSVAGYRDLRTGAAHVALTRPARDRTRAPLVRVHSECLTGDAFGSLRCDCGPQLDAALARVADAGGAVVYLGGHEGRGVGLLAKLDAYALQDAGQDTVDANLSLGLPADAREYGAAAAILHDLGIEHVRLLTNNPLKVEGLAAHGIDVVARLPLRVPAGEENARYLATKRDRMGHDLPAAQEAVGRRPVRAERTSA